MINCELNFAAYCWQGDERLVPAAPGIYCAYSCVAHGERQDVDRLLYIGSAVSLRERLVRHSTERDLNRDDEAEKRIFYSYALLDVERIDFCKDAMVRHFSPAYGDNNDSGRRTAEGIRVAVSGPWAFRIRGEFEYA